ncbi:MAG: hypothetical protein JW896_13110 [Deltaproteobacteria bacterium]|nr:hypothetical protein [Deltaproteobacteria bacterium]
MRLQGGPTRNHAMKESDNLKDLLGRVFSDVGKTIQRHKGDCVAGKKQVAEGRNSSSERQKM